MSRLSLILLLLVASCLFEPETEESLRPVHLVRSTNPIDGATNVGSGPYSISVTFRSSVDLAELSLELVSPGPFVPQPELAGRTARWADTQLPDTPFGIVALVTGPTLTRPYLFEFSSAPISQEYGRIGGQVEASSAWMGRSILVSAIERGDHLIGATMADLLAEPRVALVRTEVVREPAGYLLPYLEIDAHYYVVAAIDLDGDGKYVVGTDAFGAHGPRGQDYQVIAAEGWINDSSGRPTPGWRTDVLVQVVAPTTSHR